MPARARRRRGLGVLAAAAAAGALLPGPAQAHPFGPPQTVTISAADPAGVVHVHWRPGAADDYSYLAVGIGVSAQDRTSEPGALFHVRDDADRLAASPRFTDYLTEHLVVRDDTGTTCPSTVLPVEHLVADGAEVAFDCGGPIETVDVEVSLLTDLHPAYQTLATGPHGQRFVYTADATTHGWSFRAGDAPEDLGRSALVQLSVVGGALVVLAAAVLLLVRRSRRRTPTS